MTKKELTESSDELLNTEFPPETAKYLSWEATSFLKSPPSSFLYYSLILILFFILSISIYSAYTPIVVSNRFSGKLTQSNTNTVSAPREGILRHLSAGTGDSVERGSQIGVLDDGTAIHTQFTGVVIRKLASEQDRVRVGDPILLLSEISNNWIVSSNIRPDQLIHLKKGMPVNYHLILDVPGVDRDFKGVVLDWSGRISDSKDEVTLQMSLDPTDIQREWLSKYVTQVYNSSVLITIPLSRKPALEHFYYLLFGNS